MFRALIASLTLALMLAVPAVAATPKAGYYIPKCPQGTGSSCGEAGWTVAGGQISKNAVIPWPAGASCGQSLFVKTTIKLKDGAFTYHGSSGGKKVTWKGRWTSKTKVSGTVKWTGCSTVAHYTAAIVKR